jgi:type VI secretion system protein ImpB
MSDSGSIAPKERVNILYKPATGDAKEEIELPLKLLVLGDFLKKKDSRVVENRKPTDINKSSFNEVMSGQDLHLDLNVPDRLSGKEGAEISVSLEFKTIKDFEPESIANQVPVLKKIIELRKAVMALKGPLGNIPAIRKTIQSILENDETRDKLMKELEMK